MNDSENQNKQINNEHSGGLAAFFRRIFSNIANYGIGGLLPQVIGFFLLPVYTRFLTPEDYGIVEVVGSVGALLFVFIRLGMGGAITRYYFDMKSKEAFRQFVSTVFISIMIWGLLISVLLTFFGEDLLSGILGDVPFHPFLVIGIWSAIAAVPSEIMRRVLQVREQSRLYSIMVVSRSTLGIALSILLVVVYRMGVLGLLLAGLIDGCVFTFVTIYVMRYDLKLSFRRSALINALKYGVPMIPHHLSGWLLSMVNRILLANLDTIKAVGIYGIGYRFSLPLKLAVDAFGLAWTPMYFERRKTLGKEAESLLALSSGYLMYGFLFLTLGVSLFAKEVIIILLPENYHPAHEIVPVLVIAYLFSGMSLIVGNAIYYVKKTWIAPIVSGSSAVVNVVMNLLLIPKHGPIGTAMAMSASSVVGFILSYIFCIHLYPIKYPYRKVLLSFIIAGVIYGLGFGINGAGLSVFISLAIKVALILAFPVILIFIKVIPAEEVGRGLKLVMKRFK